MIEVANLVKEYGIYKAINNISFKVNSGEILGFLGPNGAGKSTTMNIMTGYISPTSGSVIIDGYDILKEPQKAKEKIGYLPEMPPLYLDMTVHEYLDFVADLKKVKKKDKDKMISDIKESVKISHVSDKLIKNLSKGYKQRVGLAQAIMGYPEILILDEPTVGLDPKQIIEIRDLIKSFGKNHTIILSSHILSEVSAICDRVMILSKGVIVAQDTTERLSSKFNKGHKIKVRIKGNKNNIIKALKAEKRILNLEFKGSKEEGAYDFIVEAKEDIDIREIVFKTVVKNNFILLIMESMMSLEDIFLQVTSDENNILIDENLQDNILEDAEILNENVNLSKDEQSGGKDL